MSEPPVSRLTEDERKAVIAQNIRDVLNYTEVQYLVTVEHVEELTAELVRGLAGYWADGATFTGDVSLAQAWEQGMTAAKLAAQGIKPARNPYLQEQP